MYDILMVEDEKELAELLSIFIEKAGYTVLREVRKNSSVTVLIISARVDKEDKLNGFQSGADDYIEKREYRGTECKRV